MPITMDRKTALTSVESHLVALQHRLFELYDQEWLPADKTVDDVVVLQDIMRRVTELQFDIEDIK